jgi:hypothetical protein
MKKVKWHVWIIRSEALQLALSSTKLSHGRARAQDQVHVSGSIHGEPGHGVVE